MSDASDTAAGILIAVATLFVFALALALIIGVAALFWLAVGGLLAYGLAFAGLITFSWKAAAGMGMVAFIVAVIIS